MSRNNAPFAPGCWFYALIERVGELQLVMISLVDCRSRIVCKDAGAMTWAELAQRLEAWARAARVSSDTQLFFTECKNSC